MKSRNSIIPLTLPRLFESNSERKKYTRPLRNLARKNPRKGTGSFQNIGDDKPDQEPMGMPYHLKTVNGRTRIPPYHPAEPDEGRLG